MSEVVEKPIRNLLLTREAAIVLAVAAVAWVVVLIEARGMAAMGGTMGRGLVAFVPLWTLMMTAMMLPSAAPVAVVYERSKSDRHAWRLATFSAGYMIVWGLVGIPAFVIASVASSVAMDRPSATRWIAAGMFLVAGLYQLGPLKARHLAHCRSSQSQLGYRYALYCLGCCWALMLVLVVAGIMNVLVMAVLAGVILVEKYWSRGEAFSRVVGAAAIVLAVAAIWVPALSPGLV